MGTEFQLHGPVLLVFKITYRILHSHVSILDGRKVRRSISNSSFMVSTTIW